MRQRSQFVGFSNQCFGHVAEQVLFYGRNLSLKMPRSTLWSLLTVNHHLPIALNRTHLQSILPNPLACINNLFPN
ncbi:hypothetical protein BD779DRAFT_1552931 [Infundibulicybe gibba]|nr:hypothetical protein BD779DRAFT_1552931 [Infundibulicybe gibba]